MKFRTQEIYKRNLPFILRKLKYFTFIEIENDQNLKIDIQNIVQHILSISNLQSFEFISKINFTIQSLNIILNSEYEQKHQNS